MNIAPTLAKQLDSLDITYDVIHHQFSDSNIKSAHAAHIPTSKMVKPVIFEDDKGYVMALVPANRHIKIRELNMLMNRRMGLATESRIFQLFNDCEQGAIPPVGEAYGMQTVVDSSLDSCNNLYIEAGNHTDLLHISGKSFRKLMTNAQHASICIH